MKTWSSISRSLTRLHRRGVPGFTLPEIMVVMAIFSLLVAALVASQLFGLRMYRITETKLYTTDGSRKVLSRIRNEVLSSRTLVVGNGNNGGFSPITNNNVAQIGNALQIYSSNDTNVFVRYYLNTNASALERITSLNSTPEILARGVTNRLVFQAEDFQGRPLTNIPNSRVVRMTLEFHQWEYPVANGGQNGLYDYYRLQTRITRRITD